MSVLDRLMDKVSPEPNTGCWLWTGNAHYKGYGLLKVAGKTCKAHRISYELHVGPIPPGLQLDHLCRTRCCVNPTHLEPVSLVENVRRGTTGAHQSAKQVCPRGHAFDYVSPEGKRGCKLCRREALQRSRQRRKLRASQQ